MRAVYVATPLVGFLACSPFSSDSSASSATKETPEAGAHSPDASSSSGGASDAGLGAQADLYAKEVLADGPVAYWRCRDRGPGGVHSEVGSPGADAKLGTNGPQQVAGGLFPGGGECDFKGDFAAYGTADIPYLGSSAYTLELWLKPSADPDKDNYRHIFEHTQGLTGNAYGMFLFRFEDQNLNALGVEEFTTPPNVHRSIVVPAPSKDQWHHIVVTNGPNLFIDNKPVGNVETDDTYVSFVRPFLWGSKSLDENRSILGAVTEIAVYDKTLAMDRILIHYALGRN